MGKSTISMVIFNSYVCLPYWLVVLRILKNTSQWEGLSHILWKKHAWNHQSDNGVYTLWLFNIAMENGPLTNDVPIKTSI